MICPFFDVPTYLFFTTNVPPLLYYSHIPTIIISLFVGIFVFLNGKKFLLNQLLLGISLLFSLWTIIDLITWTNINSDSILFLWSLLGLIFGFIAILSIYFIYVFLEKKDVSFRIKAVFLVLLAPIFLLSATRYNLGGFNLTECDAFKFENIFFQTYYISLGILAIIWIFVLLVRHYRTANTDSRKEIILIGIGIESFLFMFFILSYIGSYLTTIGVLADSRLEMYGLFGMTFFISLISYLIVKFKAFDIKLIGAQALVWALVILVGSEFMFVRGLSMTIQVLVGITLIISSILGLILVRSVKKEVAQKEHIEKIAGELKIANEGQENLIHIMNHQIKGFLGKARYIFAEFLEGDTFGSMPEAATPALKEGLRATTEGVNYVTEILRGSNASKGTLFFDMKPMDAKIITEELMSEMQPLAREWKVALEGTISPGEYQIIGDHTQLKEAFKNLITNAIRYNDPDYEHKSVKVSLSKTNDKILFSVRDTGKGIAPEDKAKLFTPGGVGKNSIKQNADATGFGLSFVKGCVLNHNGVVDYKSNAPEKGTTFFIELPLNQPAKV